MKTLECRAAGLLASALLTSAIGCIDTDHPTACLDNPQLCEDASLLDGEVGADTASGDGRGDTRGDTSNDVAPDTSSGEDSGRPDATDSGVDAKSDGRDAAETAIDTGAAPDTAPAPDTAVAPDSADAAEAAGDTCTPLLTCAAGKTCGDMPDGCGGTVHCGSCSFGTCDAASNTCTCTAATSCSSGMSCGTAPDGCGGVVACGTCPSGQVCNTATNACASSCTPMTSCPGGACGALDDGCGGSLACGGCAAGSTCSSATHTCVCTPAIACPSGMNCGSIADGCGGTIACGVCTAGFTCDVSNACTCTPTTSCPAGVTCGTAPDGCGGMVACGSCPSGQACNTTTGACVSTCTPLTACPVGACGVIDNGCGTGSLTCSGCGPGQACNAAHTCVCAPITACPAGRVCGTYPDGCGSSLACGSCGGGFTCDAPSNTCVCSTSCSSLGKVCGTYSDGCGGTLSCGTCGVACLSAGTSCLNVIAVSAGGNHTCAALSDGTARCWGTNGYGRLGDGTTTDRPAPTGVASLGSVVTIAAGFQDSCAFKSGGMGYCWGYNADGETGTGSATPPFSPIVTATTLATPATVAQIALASDDNFGCLRNKSGGLLCWGANGSGQLGVSDTSQRTAPTGVIGLASGVVDVATGYQHACAALGSGLVDCWGSSASGELGNGVIVGGTYSSPVRVSGISTAVKVAAGGSHSCAILSDTSVQCWGGGATGALGNGETGTSVKHGTPVAVVGLTGAVEIGAGEGFTCALLSTGHVACWGNNASGQLGNGDASLANSALPADVVGVTTATHLSVGMDHSCVTLADGSARCWGADSYSQLGDRLTAASVTPVTVQW